MSDRSFSDVIRDAVVESGISGYRLSKVADVTPAVIQRFLAGERGINLSTLEKIARVLQLRLVRVVDPPQQSDEAHNTNGGPGGLQKERKRRSKKHNSMLEKDGVILIGDGIRIRLLDIQKKAARFAIELPPGISVTRGELVEAKGASV